MRFTTKHLLMPMMLIVWTLLVVWRVAPSMAFASSGSGSVWTHVVGACVPDSESLDRYESYSARFKHKGQHTGPIYAKCNVTNPLDEGFFASTSGNPSWNTLQVVYRDPPGEGNHVTAELIRVSNSTGGSLVLATFDSNSSNLRSSPDVQTNSVSFVPHYDFVSYAYYVRVKVSRADFYSEPEAVIVRLLSTGFGSDVSTREVP